MIPMLRVEATGFKVFLTAKVDMSCGFAVLYDSLLANENRFFTVRFPSKQIPVPDNQTQQAASLL